MTPTLQECLMKLTPEELCELGFRLLVMPPEERGVRSAWIPLLLDAMDGDPLDLLLCLTAEEWRLIRDHLDPETLTIRIAQANRNLPLKDALAQLRALGLCRRTPHGWQILPKVQTLLNADDQRWQIVETADHVYAAILGYLRVYGMMPAGDLVRMVAPAAQGRMMPDQTDVNDFIVSIWRRRNGLADLLMSTDGLWLICPEADDVDKLYADLHQPRLQMKQYAPYSLEEALAIGHGMPPGRCDAYDEIIAFYASHGVDKAAALDVLDHAVLLFQQNQFEESMAALIEPLNAPPTPAQVRLLKLVFLRAPAWRMKGSCAEDLMSPSARVSKRVRQDDPCPCGSGRKYKHCCGRLQ